MQGIARPVRACGVVGVVAVLLCVAGSLHSLAQEAPVVDLQGNVLETGDAVLPEVVVRFRGDSLVGPVAEELFGRGQSFASITGRGGLDATLKRFGVRRLARASALDAPAAVPPARITAAVARELGAACEQRARDRAARRRADFPQRAGRGRDTGATPQYLYRLTVDSAAAAQEAATVLAQDPDVLYAEPNQVIISQMVPNDPYYSSSGSWGQTGLDDLWGLKQIHAEGAWDVATGAGVTVAVVDSGVDYTHEDLAANVWQNPGEIAGNGVDDDGNGYVDDVYGYDFYNGDADPLDDCGHGTHVAGIVAATGNNGLGVIGVAHGARVMALKGMNRYGTGDSIAIYNAIRYAVAEGADVVNCSFGGAGTGLAVTDAVQQALAAGCVVVCSAGNDTLDARWHYPGNVDGTIVVGASTYDASFDPPLQGVGCHGGKVDVYAPGGSGYGGVLSLLASGSYYQTYYQTYYPNLVVAGKYLPLTGTSMAAPHVAGVVALLLENSPALTVEQIRWILRSTAQDNPASPGWDHWISYGVLDAAAAVGVSVPASLCCFITAPAYWLPGVDNAMGNGVREVRGTATGVGFARYEIARAAFSQLSPESFTTLAQSTTPVEDGVLGLVDTTGWAPGEYYLRVRVIDDQGRNLDSITRVCVDPTVEPGWPRLATSRWQGLPSPCSYSEDQSLTFADLDADGADEVVAVSGQTLYAWRHDGTPPTPGFPQYISGILGLRTAPAVADLDGDGDQEIVLVAEVAPTGQPLYAFHHDGTPVTGFPCANPDPLIPSYCLRLSGPYSPAITDLDADGHPDIVFACGTYNTNYAYTYLVAVAADGTTKPGFPAIVSSGGDFLSQAYAPRTSLAVADLDADGSCEIVIGATYDTPTAGLRVFSATGQLLRDIALDTTTREVQHPMVADWDGDGTAEITALASHQEAGGPYLLYAHVVSADGTPRPGWPVALANGSDLTLLCDIDSDGDLELTCPGTISGSSQRCLRALELDGTPSSASPLPVAVAATESSPVFTAPPVVARVTAAGGVGFCLPTDWMGVYGCGTSASRLPGCWPKPIPGSGGSAAVADLDGDGAAELGLHSADGFVYVFQEPTTLAGPRLSEWAALHANNGRTGVPTLPRVAVASGYPTTFEAGAAQNVAVTWQSLPAAADYRIRLCLVGAADSRVYASATLESFVDSGRDQLMLTVDPLAPETTACRLEASCERRSDGTIVCRRMTAADVAVVAAANRPPAITDPLSKADADAGVVYAATLAGDATDPDAGDTLTFSKVSGPAWLTVAAAGTLSGTPAALDAGPNSFVVRVTDAGGLAAEATLTITVRPGPVDDLATADTLVVGTVTGSYLGTQAGDDGYELLREVLSGGKPNARYSYLEHKWTLSVTGGTAVTFFVEAHHSTGSDTDHFVFAYSTNGTAFTDVLTVTKTVDDDVPQSVALPASVVGTVTIRVRDTNRTAGRTVLDTLYVDHLFIRSEGVDTRPPAPAAGPTPAAGATGVDTQADLSWTAGARAISHDVFLGTAPTPGSAEFRANTTAAGFDPGALGPNTTYYWRIDEVGAFGRTTGPVWSFTTGAAAPEMFVNGIAMGWRKAGKNYIAQATVSVRDTTGANVAGAAVTGTWSGAASGTVAGTTLADGRVLLESPGSKSGGTFTFTVTGLAKSGVTYNPTRNVATSAAVTAP